MKIIELIKKLIKAIKINRVRKENVFRKNGIKWTSKKYT